MNKRSKAVVAIILIVLAAVAGFYAIRYYLDTRASNFNGKYVLYVGNDATLSSIMDSIVANAGIVREGSLYRMADKENLQLGFKQGRYVIEPGMTAVYVVRMINNGWQTPANLTISGYIRNSGRLAKVLARNLQIDSADIAPLLSNDTLLGQYGFSAETVLGMILPDTYHIYWTSSPEQVVERLYQEYGKFWDSTRVAKADSIGLTPLQVSTMASIIMEESNAKEEYPTIAGVYLNRLKRGMKLQADPTARFASGDFTLTRILYKHTKIDSPYNTYMYKGLPPAPINVASKAAIDAVLNAEDHKYIFFCARPEFDGRHNFAVTFSEHQKNARAYQAAYREWVKKKNQQS